MCFSSNSCRMGLGCPLFNPLPVHNDRVPGHHCPSISVYQLFWKIPSMEFFPTFYLICLRFSFFFCYICSSEFNLNGGSSLFSRTGGFLTPCLRHLRKRISREKLNTILRKWYWRLRERIMHLWHTLNVKKKDIQMDLWVDQHQQIHVFVSFLKSLLELIKKRKKRGEIASIYWMKRREFYGW